MSGEREEEEERQIWEQGVCELIGMRITIGLNLVCETPSMNQSYQCNSNRVQCLTL